MTQIMRTPKQPWEVFAVGINFSLNMESTESINASSSNVTIIEVSTGEDKTSEILSGSLSVQGNQTLLAVIQGGTDGSKYKATFRAYISATKQLEEDLIFDVIDS